MLPGIAASAAARALGYAGLADLIETEQLSVARIAFMFLRASASKHSGSDLAVILLAAAHARYRAAPFDWDESPERQLALLALKAEPNPEAALEQLGKDASRIVAQSRAAA
jgi:hypothetical protein